MDKIIQKIPRIEDDMNGHMGSDILINYDRVYERNRFRKKNEDIKKVYGFTLRHDLVIMNIYFKKRVEHCITYKSGANKSKMY